MWLYSKAYIFVLGSDVAISHPCVSHPLHLTIWQVPRCLEGLGRMLETGLGWLCRWQRLKITYELWSKPWLVGSYRGWHTTQVYRDYNKPIIQIPINQPGFHGMSQGFWSLLIWYLWYLAIWIHDVNLYVHETWTCLNPEHPKKNDKTLGTMVGRYPAKEYLLG